MAQWKNGNKDTDNFLVTAITWLNTQNLNEVRFW
jgi:hypothetical protein